MGSMRPGGYFNDGVDRLNAPARSHRGPVSGSGSLPRAGRVLVQE